MPHFRPSVCCKWTGDARIFDALTFFHLPEVQMRRFAFVMAVPVILLGGCDPAGLTDSTASVQFGGSTSVQSDSISAPPAHNSPENAPAGGIGIGSGT
jgi:hypothetical protein